MPVNDFKVVQQPLTVLEATVTVTGVPLNILPPQLIPLLPLWVSLAAFWCRDHLCIAWIVVQGDPTPWGSPKGALMITATATLWPKKQMTMHTGWLLTAILAGGTVLRTEMCIILALLCH